MNQKEVNKSLKVSDIGPSGVAIKIHGDSAITFGRHFTEKNQIVSLLTRDSIDSLKNHFRDELTMDDWRLVKQLKTTFDII